MKLNPHLKEKGFTLIELMLVTVIISIFIYMSMNYMQQKMQAERMDRTVLQTQQILNASLAYYIDKGEWPAIDSDQWSSPQEIQDEGYLPQGAINSPWGPDPDPHTPAAYNLSPTGKENMLYLKTYVGKNAQSMVAAKIMASKTPMGQACRDVSMPDKNCQPCASNAACYLVAAVNVPGQNLNNAMAVNYTGLFHSGACVKAPSCPIDMIPSVMVVPVSVTGAYDAPTCTDPNDPKTCTSNAYPINNFIGTATAITPPLPVDDVTPTPPPCSSSAPRDCMLDASSPLKGKKGDQYWRVCINVDTSRGRVMPGTNTTWGQLIGTVMVLTRCMSPSQESRNSTFNVYQ